MILMHPVTGEIIRYTDVWRHMPGKGVTYSRLPGFIPNAELAEAMIAQHTPRFAS